MINHLFIENAGEKPEITENTMLTPEAEGVWKLLYPVFHARKESAGLSGY